MKKVIINGVLIEESKDITILELAKANKIDIPNLCFLKDCNGGNNCGICGVEVEGEENLITACNTIIKDGMVINTKSERVLENAKEKVSKLLDTHEFKCGPCKRRENCEFLKIVIKTKGRASKPFIVENKKDYIDDRSKSLVIDRSKCVKCGRCVAACKAKTGTESIEFYKKDDVKIIRPKNGISFDEGKCLLCGQCVMACPVDALYEKSHIERVKEALEDPKKHVLVAIAPSVRTAMGELFGMGYGVDVTGKLYSALRLLGFDKIFDINFGADMTIMEEATELLERIKNNGPFPMFTSCCPAWVRQVENYYPNYLENLSTAKSPQQIFGTATKTYYPHIEDIDPKDVFTVTIMPCTAKKFEADREEMKYKEYRDIDAVITTRELARFIKEKKIDFKNLEDSECDPAMGEYTGAGAIFGATGGVMEAALRTAKDFIENQDLSNIEYKMVRGLKGIKEAKVILNNKEYNIAVVNGAKNLKEFMDSDNLNKKQYHFIEVMACEGGCVNGGGQPHISSSERENINIREVRASVLYNQDRNLKKRKSHENTALIKMYKTYFGEAGKGKAHELLHHKYK